MQQRFSRPLQTGHYHSVSLGREQNFVWFAPENAAENQRFPLLVLLHGMDCACTDWSQYTRLARYAAQYDLVIAMPDGGNGWYTNAFDGSTKYEDDLMQDFLQAVRNHLPVLPSGKAWGIGGLSMGGYGAVKLALKYPHIFSLAVSHSGSMEKPHLPEPHPVFGDPQADASFRRRENVFWLAEQAMCRWPTERPYLFLDCGLSDEKLDINRQFRDHLRFIGYPHTYREMPGHHTWPYWDRALKTILPEVVAVMSDSFK